MALQKSKVPKRCRQTCKQCKDPDQTARGAVWSESALFVQTYLSENVGSLRYLQYNYPQVRIFNPHLTTTIRIKNDFSFINIRKVPREMLKTRAKPKVFNTSLGTLRMLLNDKIMFDCYYCINSKKTRQKVRKCLHTLFFIRTTIFLHAHILYKYPQFKPWPGTFFMVFGRLSMCIAWWPGECI